MISALDISTSGLIAQRIQLDAIAGNIANASSQRNANGELSPYRARQVIFETDEQATAHGASGVRVAEVRTDAREPLYRNEPNNPLAIKSGKHKGQVAYPNVNLTKEFTDALVATRAYEANIGVMEITRNMGQQTLRILA